MEDIVQLVKARREELKKDLEYERKEQTINPAKYREYLIRSIIKNIDSAEKFLLNVDSPQGKIH